MDVDASRGSALIGDTETRAAPGGEAGARDADKWREGRRVFMMRAVDA